MSQSNRRRPVSPETYRALGCALSSLDDPEAVRVGLLYLAEMAALGVTPIQLTMSYVHQHTGFSLHGIRRAWEALEQREIIRRLREGQGARGGPAGGDYWEPMVLAAEGTEEPSDSGLLPPIRGPTKNDPSELALRRVVFCVLVGPTTAQNVTQKHRSCSIPSIAEMGSLFK